MNKEIKNFGLIPLPRDARDFPLGAVFDLPELKELPPDFVIGLPTVRDQKDSDFCAAAASCAVSELQEGVPLAFEWVFAASKVLSGNVDSYGQDLRTICKVHQKFGAPSRTDTGISLNNFSTDFCRRIENYPKELYEKAKKHQKGSYFAITGPYDHFDNLRATMWKFRDEKCGVVFGVLWSWGLQQVYMQKPGHGGGHALAQIGWTTAHGPATGYDTPTLMMFIQNSYGGETGEGGRHYFSREVINAFVDMYGAFMFHDMPKETAQKFVKCGIREGDDVVDVFFKKVLAYFKNIFS